MTVTYTRHVATCKGFGCFWKLLFRWRGSIYKLMWPELLAYTIIYYLLSLLYRFLLYEDQRRLFEKVSLFCQQFSELIPLSFVLGFYVTIVVQRWWEQYMSLPWPDSLALFVSTSIHGLDQRSRLMRRTVMRYVNLSQTITLIMISPKVKKRFPTLEHLVESGLMTLNEQKIFDDLDAKTAHPKYWMPLVWAGSIIARARKEGRIRDDFAVKTILDEINRIRGLCGGLLSYDWISIPLVYTQVVTLAVYSFFMATLMGRQFLEPTQNIPKHQVDFYVPVFTLLQFFFFMGWLKVAESLVNPFGEDDDDFEVNWLVDRNLQVSYLIVDEMHNEHPELIQDIYWEEVFPQELPYTIAAEQFRRDPPQGSTANLEVPEQEQEFLPVVEEEEDEGIHESTSGINDAEKGSTKAINIVKNRNSAKSSTSGLGTSQQFPSRKPSLLSMIFNRGVSNSNDDNLSQSGVRHNASSTSMRPRGRPRGLMRSVSRMSTGSQTTCQSPESTARNPNATQDSAIFRMSDVSLNANAMDDLLSPISKSRKNSGDDDEPIHIKIKQRDSDGNVIIMGSSEEVESGRSSSRAHHQPKAKRPRSSTVAEAATGVDQQYSDDGRSILFDDENLNPVSPIEFADEADSYDEESTDLSHKKKKKGLSNLNLKGLSKLLPSASSQREESSTSQPKTRSNENLDGERASEHDLPGPDNASPGTYWRTPRMTYDSMSAKPDKVQANISLSPFDSEESKQSREDIFVYPEITQPKAPLPEKKISEPSFPFYSSTEQHLAPKDTLETIIEGPREGTLEGAMLYREDTPSSRKRLISESELEVIPELDFMSAQLESDRLLKPDV
ncbi:hypothetical protein Pmani_018963 [Petrolisthes manimaculis]|uniref:Bestrophin homolog n=2 Tax=Petrolisthes manimaculis TaxID=1843537 RepID=A0AAE1PLE3_9EUCA|nr:hypothetical protein Pmani_018963 [Petrolisthes manimaculis]